MRALAGSLLHFKSTPSRATRSSIMSVTVIGGMRRGLQAAATNTMAVRHPQATIDLIEIGIKLPNGNVTQNNARRAPRGCDTHHGLAMFLGQSCTGGAFDPGEAHVYRSDVMSVPKSAKQPVLDFETAMRDLEELVERLEHGDLPLEESLAAFERGVMLTRVCQTALKEAEQKVEILLKKAGESAVEDFTPDESKAG